MLKKVKKMNKKNFSVNLPLDEAIRRSFGYVFGDLGLLFRISALWLLLLWLIDIGAGFPSLCSLNSEDCRGGGKQILSFAAMSIASFAVVIAYIRCIVLHIAPEKYGTLNFGRRELLYIGKVLAFVAVIAVPAFLFGVLAGFIGAFLQIDSAVSVRLSLLGAFICLFVGFRFYLAFPAVAVDNKEIDFQKSFILTKGNNNKIFWGFVVVTLPGWLSLIALALVFRGLNSDIYLVKMLFAALTLIISFIDVGIKASYMAHLYQYFIYFYQKWQQEEKE